MVQYERCNAPLRYSLVPWMEKMSLSWIGLDRVETVWEGAREGGMLEHSICPSTSPGRRGRLSFVDGYITGRRTWLWLDWRLPTARADVKRYRVRDGDSLVESVQRCFLVPRMNSIFNIYWN